MSGVRNKTNTRTAHEKNLYLERPVGMAYHLQSGEQWEIQLEKKAEIRTCSSEYTTLKTAHCIQRERRSYWKFCLFFKNLNSGDLTWWIWILKTSFWLKHREVLERKVRGDPSFSCLSRIYLLTICIPVFLEHFLLNVLEMKYSIDVIFIFV